MKKNFLVTLLLVGLLSGCASPGYYNTQYGAAGGAAIGALAGGLIGGSTAGALIGAGAGTLIGGVVGNGFDQQRQQQMDNYLLQQQARQQQEIDSRSRCNTPRQNQVAPPRGRWVTVQGRWSGGVWVPTHQEWQPY